MIRFFADPGSIHGNTIYLSAEDSEHIRSLRLRPDEQFTVCDGNGFDYICRLSEASREPGAAGGDRPDVSAAQIIHREKTDSEPTVACHVYIAYMKNDRLDYAVQKSVELGARKIILFKSQRCIAIPKDVPRKVERLGKIALETAKQSGRGIIPEVTAISDFSKALKDASRSDLSVMFYEEEHNLHLMTVLEHHFPFVILVEKPMKMVKAISIITGPEGGFEPAEAEEAKAADIPVITLGPRVLRSETAPVAVLSAIMYHTGNL